MQTKEATFIVHHEGKTETIGLDANGRILNDTEGYDAVMPEWAHNGLSVAMLAERAKFYTTRLGPEIAGPILGSNTINYADLDWVCVDDTGDATFTLEADAEWRQNTLATALGIDREQGTIDNAITEHWIDNHGGVYKSQDEAAGKAEADQHLLGRAVNA